MKSKNFTNSWASIIFLGWLGILSTQAYAQQNALDFDGKDDIVESQIKVSGSYTKEALVYLRELAAGEINAEGFNNNIASGNPGTANTAFWIPTTNGRRLAAGHNGKWFTVQDTAVFPTGRWMHVAVTFDANNRVFTLYKNGVQVSQATISAADTKNYSDEGGDSLQIGGFVGANFLKGALDEVRIWSTVRTAEEIKASMQQPLAVTEPGLIAYYNANQGTADKDNTVPTPIDSLTNSVAGAKSGILSGFALTGTTSNFITSTALDAAATDIVPPAGYTVAIDQASIDASNQTAVSFTIANPGDAVKYYYSIKDAADSVVAGSGPIADQPTGIDVSGLADGDLQLSVILEDAAGNTGAPATAMINKSALAIAATITSEYDSVANQSPIPITITFNKKASGFAVADLTVTNGAATELATLDSITFAANITPENGGAVIVTLPAGAVTDAQGGASTEEATFSILYDVSALTVALSTQEDSVFTADVLNVSITFSELVSGFALSDLKITNGTADTLVTGDSIIFTTGITPSDVGPVTIELPAEAATAVNGGKPNAAATPLTRVYQPSGAPSVKLTTTASNPTNLESVPVTITFSSAVSKFTIDGLELLNAAADTLITQDSTTFTTNLSPVIDSIVSIAVKENAAVDAAGSGNVASQLLSIIYDGTAPTAALTTDASDTVSANFAITITFSEAVVSFDSTKLMLTNAIAGNVQTADSTVFTADIMPDTTGAVLVTIDSGMVADLAGNGNMASDTLSLFYDATTGGGGDTVAPTLTITSSETDTTQASTFVATFTFSERVSKFDSTDIAIDSAAISKLTTSDSTTFTANVMTMDQGTIKISVPDGAAVDAAGNASKAASYSIFYQKSVTGIEELFVQDAMLKMYPIPSGQTLNVAFQLKKASKVTIELRSISGQLVQRKVLGKTASVDESLGLYNVPNGVYVLTLYMGQEKVNRKVIVNR